MFVISACLVGVNCKYNGGNNLDPRCKQLLNKYDVKLICPEQAGGLPCPRPPAEIVGMGGGIGIWNGTARVIDANGQDVTEEFKQGALACLEVIKCQPNIEAVILKSRSPSCGVGSIYDGSFSRKTVAGDGVAAALFRQHGYKVFDVDEYFKAKEDGEQ